MPSAGDRIVIGGLNGPDVPIGRDEESGGPLADADEKDRDPIASEVMTAVPGGEKGEVIRTRAGAALVSLDCGATGWVTTDLVARDREDIPPGKLSPRCPACGTQPAIKAGSRGLVFRAHKAGGDRGDICTGSQGAVPETGARSMP